MQKQFACLANYSGVPITPELWDELNFTVSLMVLQGKDRISIKTESCEGELRTKFEIYCVGSIAGIKVDGILESSHGKGSVSFLVQPEMELKKKLFHWIDGVELDFRPLSTNN